MSGGTDGLVRQNKSLGRLKGYIDIFKRKDSTKIKWLGAEREGNNKANFSTGLACLKSIKSNNWGAS